MSGQYYFHLQRKQPDIHITEYGQATILLAIPPRIRKKPTFQDKQQKLTFVPSNRPTCSIIVRASAMIWQGWL